MVPKLFGHIPIANTIGSLEENASETILPVYEPQDDVFLSLVHVALKLRSDILSISPYQGENLSREDANACIPESLFMFLKILYGGPGCTGERA